MRKTQTVKDNDSALRMKNGQVSTTEQEAASILGEYFQEMFTREEDLDFDLETNVMSPLWNYS